MALVKIVCGRCSGHGKIPSDPARRRKDANSQHSCGAGCSVCAAGQLGDYALEHGAPHSISCPGCGGKGYQEREEFEGRSG